jgi:hypothetical protein
MRGYTTVSASMFGFSVARITGPNSLLNNWALDPDLYRGVPGLALQPDSGGKEPYRLILQPSKRNSIHYSKESATIAVQGDLDSFQREDFRRLVVHIAKTAVRRANHQLVHAAGIVGPSNEAALLCGSQGSGKTTTALYLSDRTCRICATDLCLVNADLRVVGGSTHVNLYPEMLRRYFPNLAEACISDQEAGSAFDRKISLDPTLLGAARFADLSHPVPIARIFVLSVRARESDPYCAALPATERIRQSIVASDDWVTSDWLSPSWRVFFPSLETGRTRRLTENAVVRFASLPHHCICGEVDFAGDIIRRMMTSRTPVL